jgi:hypothetical protein
MSILPFFPFSPLRRRRYIAEIAVFHNVFREIRRFHREALRKYMFSLDIISGTLLDRKKVRGKTPYPEDSTQRVFPARKDPARFQAA